jgi:hypothetical protein
MYCISIGMKASAAICRLPLPRNWHALPNARHCWRNSATLRTVCAGFCLAVAALLVYRLTAVSVKTGQPFRPDDLMDGVASFDSFSEPAVAYAILSREAERLLLLYREMRDQELISQAWLAGASVQPASQSGTGQLTGPLTGAGNRSELQTLPIQSLTALDAQVQNLHVSLGGKLLSVYYDHRSWNEFVDCYLQLAGEAPGQIEVSLWARCALDCSQKCGRAQEVEDALQHIVRFHPELRTAGGLKDALTKWKTASSPDFEVSTR